MGQQGAGVGIVAAGTFVGAGVLLAVAVGDTAGVPVVVGVGLATFVTVAVGTAVGVLLASVCWRYKTASPVKGAVN